MIVVSDSTPLIHLAKVGSLEILFSLYKEVVITKKVHREAVEEGLLLEKEDARVIQGYVGNAILVKSPKFSSKSLAKKYSIHKGEADSIQLAKEIGASLVLINEREGRSAAKGEGLTVRGTIGIVFDALKAGIITEKVALKIFKTFKTHPQDFWIKPLVIDAAIEKIGSGAGP